MAASKSIGVGVISLGWMGRLHTRGYRTVAERYPQLGVTPRLVAASDVTDLALRDATEVLGFERAYPDYHDVICDPQVDVVSICGPNFLHKEMALAAIEAGKPFWIEKPMGVDAAESREIALAAQAASVPTAVGFNYRHTPAIQHLRELVRGGRLGQITNVRAWLIADYAASPRGPLTWRYDRAKGGSGVLGDLLSHGFDLGQYVIGRIASVSAMSSIFITERPYPLEQGIGHGAVKVSDETGPVGNEDYAAVLTRFENGVLGTFEASRVSVGPRAEYVIEVYGTSGSARWNFEHPNHLKVLIAGEGEHHGYTSIMDDASHGDFSRFQPGPGQTMSFDDAKTIECKLFLETVTTGRQVAPSAADAWSAAECDEAAVASAADGRWHDVRAVEGPVTYDA